MSKLFDVCPRSTLEEMEQQDEVRVAWGTGIAGHVAESGDPVNIPDAYQVSTNKYRSNFPPKRPETMERNTIIFRIKALI